MLPYESSSSGTSYGKPRSIMLWLYLPLYAVIKPHSRLFTPRLRWVRRGQIERASNFENFPSLILFCEKSVGLEYKE